MQRINFKNTEEKQQLCKKIYEYLISINWDETKTIDFSKELDIPCKEIRQYAIDYYDTKKYTELHNQNELDVMDWQKEIQISLLEILHFKEIHLITNNMPEFINHHKRFGKYLYEEIIRRKGIIGSLSEYVGLDISDILLIAEEYTKQHNLPTLKRGVGYKQALSKCSFVFDELLKTNDLSKIIDIIDSSGIDISYIKKGIYNYILVNNGIYIADVEKNLRDKCDMYCNYKNKINEDIRKKRKDIQTKQYIDENLEVATHVITDFIKSEIKVIGDYCKEKNIDIDDFKIWIELVKEYNIELHEKYKEKVDSIQKQRFAIIANEIRRLVQDIKIGINENNINRSFDLIDYFLNYKFSFQSLDELAKTTVDKKDYAILKRFISINKNYEKTNSNDIKAILDETVELNCAKTKEGYPIPGTGEIVSEQKKQMLIEYLKTNHIPVNRRTYNLIFKRYNDGLLEINKNILN